MRRKEERPNQQAAVRGKRSRGVGGMLIKGSQEWEVAGPGVT
jgi:hypothetical protein